VYGRTPSSGVDSANGALPLHPADPVVLESSPGGLRTVGLALWRALGRPQGELPDGATLPGLAVQLSGVRITPADVAAYRSVCQLDRGSDIVPVPMPEILFNEMIGRLVTDARFPLSPLGLIHIRQTFEGTFPIVAGRPYDLECRMNAVRRSERGYELDVRLSLSEGAESLWTAMTTLLSRAPSVRRTRGGQQPGEASDLAGSTEIEIAGDTGRRFARVSGDWNPHHLWTLTARPLGYERPIAHGMWMLTRLLRLLPESVDTAVGTISSTFHRPVFLPGKVAARVVKDGDAWTLDAFSPERGTPHIRGAFRPLPPV